MKCVMKIVCLVCCVAAWRSALVAASDMSEPTDTIRFLTSYTNYNEDHIIECMPEHTHYNLRPHQNVTIQTIFKNTKIIRLDVMCRTSSFFQEIITNNKNTGPWYLGYNGKFIDVGNENTQLYCLYSLGFTSTVCQANLQIGEAVTNDTALAHNTISSYLCAELMINDGQLPTTRVYEHGFFDDTELRIFCMKDGFNGKLSLVIRDNNGNTISNNSDWMSSLSLKKFVKLNKTCDGYKCACILNHLTTNSSWETVIKLKYRKERASGEDGATQDEAAVSDSHNSEPRPRSQDNSDYEVVYDVIYEDRRRIERLHEQAQQADRENSKRPAPPPVDTIPHREVHSFPPRPVEPTTTDSLIAPCDRYLLNIDSDGYEIPDQLKFFPLQRHISEDDT